MAIESDRRAYSAGSSDEVETEDDSTQEGPNVTFMSSLWAVRAAATNSSSSSSSDTDDHSSGVSGELKSSAGEHSPDRSDELLSWDS
jgi:hypothetical protein